MSSFLKRPYPRSTDAKAQALSALGYGVFTIAFLACFRPFLFGDSFRGGSQYLPAIYYGIVCTVCLLLKRLTPFLFRRTYEESRWTVGKEIGSDAVGFFFVGLGVWLFTVIKYALPPTPGTFLQFLGVVVAIGLIPHTIFVLIKQNRLLSKYRQAAGELQKELGDTFTPPLPEVRPLLLRAENPKESLEIIPEKLICIEASDNYIRVFRADLPVVLLRSSLKRAEEDLIADPVFFRCHRGYIVNLSKVLGVSGNAQGLKLQLEGLPNLTVPVSRGLNPQISALLKRP